MTHARNPDTFLFTKNLRTMRNPFWQFQRRFGTKNGDIHTLLGFFIRGFIWDIPVLMFACVLFSGPTSLKPANARWTWSTQPLSPNRSTLSANPLPETPSRKPQAPIPVPWAVEYHTLMLLFLKEPLWNKKFKLFSPWLLKRPVPNP